MPPATPSAADLLAMTDATTSTLPALRTLPSVMIPGLACSPRLFAPQLPTLWRFGPVTVANTLQHNRIADMARAILDQAPAQFVLLGLSMGGYIALEIMRQAPERVIGLCIMNSSARADTEESQKNRQRLMALAGEGRLQLATEMNFPRSVHPAHKHDKDLLATVLAMAKETGVASYIQQQEAILHRIDSLPSLDAITCPTLIMVGDQDQLTPLPLAQELSQGIAGSKLRIIANCGHLSTLEQTQQVNRALQQWLSTLQTA